MAEHIDQSLPAQRKIVLECLRRSPHTTYELRRQGISHPASRVRELIAEGHLIESARVTTVDQSGYTHSGVARYAYVSGPSCPSAPNQ